MNIKKELSLHCDVYLGSLLDTFTKDRKTKILVAVRPKVKFVKTKLQFVRDGCSIIMSYYNSLSHANALIWKAPAGRTRLTLA